MSLTSSSTLAEVRAAYDDNCCYDVNGSVSQARLFVQACRMLLNRVPAETQFAGGERVREETARLQTALDQAANWLRGRGEMDGSAFVRQLSVEDFRT